MAKGKKGDLDYTISTNPQKAMQDMAKIVGKLEQQVTKLKATNREAKKVGKSFGAMGRPLNSVVGNVGQLTAGFLTAQGAAAGLREIVNLLKRDYEDVIRKQGEAAKATRSWAEGMVPAIRDWVGADKTDQAIKAFEEMLKKTPSLSPVDVPGYVRAYSGARAEATYQEGVRAIRMAGRSPYTPQQRETLLATVGELQQIMPGKKLGDVFDISTAMMGRGGKFGGKIPEAMKGVHKLVEMGIPAETALGTMMAAFQTEQGGRGLGTLVSLLGKTITAPAKRYGIVRTPAELAKLEVAEMKTPMEKFQWLRKNQDKAADVFDSTWPTVAPIFRKGEIGAGMQAISAAQKENLYEASWEATQKSVYGKRVMTYQEQKAAVDILPLTDPKGALKGEIRKSIHDYLMGLPWLSATRRELIETKLEFENYFGGDYIDAAKREIRSLREEVSRPGREFDINYYGTKMRINELNKNYNPELAAMFTGMLKRIDTLVALFEAEKSLQTNTAIEAGD